MYFYQIYKSFYLQLNATFCVNEPIKNNPPVLSIIAKFPPLAFCIKKAPPAARLIVGEF